MDEKQSIPNNQSAEAESTAQTNQNQTTGNTTFEQFLNEAGDVILDVLAVAGKSAEDLTGIMIFSTDKEMRENLDVMVESGAAKNRAEALKILIKDGVQSNQAVYENVEKTRAQIISLKNQLKGLFQQA
mgnify:FL=1|jgi:hypothetical protein